MPARDEMKMLVRLLRSIRGASQDEMGAAASIDRTTISRYETGEMIPPRTHMARLAGAAGLSLPFAESVLLPVVRLVLEPSVARQTTPVSPDDRAAAIEQRLLATVRSGFAAFGPALSARQAIDRSVLPAAEDRRAIPDLWARFAACPPDEQRDLVEGTPDFQTWAFSEKLCEESVTAASENALRALDLARLGLLAAHRSLGDASWKAHLQGYAWAFVGNALRVGGDLSAADAAFAMTRRLWREQGAQDDRGVLAAWRVPDLEASLRRAQRNWRYALDLLDGALKMAPPDAIGRVLVNKATVLELSGEVGAALAMLDEADRLIGADEPPRLRWTVDFNRVACLCHFGRYSEAEVQFCRVSEVGRLLDNDLDYLRIAWLKARLAAGLGNKKEARQGFENLRAAYLDRQSPYELALVSLELAILYLEEGRLHEVREMAESMFCIFGSQRVHREALAALRLFCEATEAESASAAQVRKLRAYLDRARKDPQLIFGSSLST